MGNTAVKGEHPPMAIEPVAAFHILRRPRKEQLAEAQGGNEHVGFADLSGFQLDPLERIAGVIDLNTFGGHELARCDARAAVLPELTVELLPEVRVRDQVLGALRPQILKGCPRPRSWIIVGQSTCSIHTDRSEASLTQAIPLAPLDLANQPPRASQCPRYLAYAPAFGQPSFDLRVSVHRQLPPRHIPLPFVPYAQRYRAFLPKTGSAGVGPIRRNRLGP